MNILELLFFDVSVRAIVSFVLIYATLSWGLGRLAGTRSIPAAAYGYLILIGGTDLALFVARALALPLFWFGALAAAISLAIAGALRILLPRPDQHEDENPWTLGLIAAALVLVLWILRIIQLDPSSNTSSHHAWYPLFIENSFRLGHLAVPEEMAFGLGYLTSISYNVDLMGPAILGRWTGLGSAWQAYSASSTFAALLSVSIIAHGLRRSRTAMAVYGVLVGAMLIESFLYRTSMARNWGDAVLFLGGAVMLYQMTCNGTIRDKMLWTCAAAAFLVFSRHYGAFYGGMMIIIGYLAAGWLEEKWHIGRWFGLGILLVLFSAREIACILFPPSPFYPGSKLVEAGIARDNLMLIGALNDLGLLLDDHIPKLLLWSGNLYLIAVAAFLVVAFRRRFTDPIPRSTLVSWFMPLVLLALPQLLQNMVGYRTSYTYSKTMLIGLHVMVWYPAFAVKELLSDPQWAIWRRRGIIAGTLITVIIAIFMLPRLPVSLDGGPGQIIARAQTLHRAHNPDLTIANGLREELGTDFAATAKRPILYFHYEPGLGLRNFIGGSFFCDYDFWSDPVRAKMATADTLEDLVKALGYPNLYLSFGESTAYSRYTPPNWRRFQPELATLDQANWVERQIKSQSGSFYITKQPKNNDSEASQNPAPACQGTR